MTRSELVTRIAEQNLRLYAKDIEQVVDAIIDRMTAALVKGDRVELRGFGAFCVRDGDPRSAKSSNQKCDCCTG